VREVGKEESCYILRLRLDVGKFQAEKREKKNNFINNKK